MDFVTSNVVLKSSNYRRRGLLLQRSYYTSGGTERHRVNYSYHNMGVLPLMPPLAQGETTANLEDYIVSFRPDRTGAYGLVDNLTYTLNGNQITKVEDAVTTAAYSTNTAFTNGASAANEYTYDNNGNLTKDSNKGITNITYNCLNLPSVVTFSSGNTITYTYAADGSKLRTAHKIGTTTTTTDYCGNVIYENGVQKRLLTEEGYVDLSVTTPVYYYYLKDHQGNNRVVINSSGTVQETNHYYPFGGTFTASSVQPYKYNGKELDTKAGLNWYDYGARHYDAVLGRFMTIDPLSEKDYSTSPYAYCGSNPVIRVDKDGKIWDTVWDITSFVTGVKSFRENVKAGNVSGAITDAVGITVDAVAMAVPGIPGGVGTGLKTLRTADKAVDAAKKISKGNDAMKYRVKLRKSTKEAVKDAAPKTKTGAYIDPNTNQPIESGQEVFGHKFGQEWGKYKTDPKNQNKTRKEVINDQNNPDIYQIEDKKSNASHKYEEDWKKYRKQ